MQQNQKDRLFADAQPQQPIYRFPQNQNLQGWQPQQNFSAHNEPEEAPLSRKDKHSLKRKHKRRRILTLWNLFAVIGFITVIIQAARYIVIPLLVQLKVLAGGMP